MSQPSPTDIRMIAVDVLRKRGFVVDSIAKGVGSPPFSMLRASRGAETFFCAVKAVTRPQGRIHFGCSDKGGWISLSKATHVIHVWCHPNTPDQVTVSLFPAKVVVDAFDQNFALRKIAGTEALPIWLSPKFETGERFEGSGFEAAALWSETVPSRPVLTLPPAGESVAKSGASVMETVKAMLASHLGVSIDRIEIDVRVKL